MQDYKHERHHVGKHEPKFPDEGHIRGQEYRSDVNPEDEHDDELPRHCDVLHLASHVVPVFGVGKGVFGSLYVLLIEVF